MAEASGPWHKRRRLDNAQGTISSEEIQRSNATVEHFTGQRHNRWMQGHIPSAGNGGDTDTRARVSNQTGNGAGSGRSLPANENDRSVDRMEVNTVMAHANRPHSDEAGASTASPAVSAASATIVGYESPYIPFAPSTSNGRKSLERNISTSATNMNPGLPSPAPSDETNNSPIAGGLALPPAGHMANGTAQPRRRGRPPNNPTSILPSNGTPIPLPPDQQQQQRPQAASHGGHGHGGPGRQSGASPASHLLTSGNQRQPSHDQGSPTVPQPPARSIAASPTANFKPFSPQVLKVRIDRFEARHLSESRNQGVDEGRLSLLRDAVWPQVDWFYLALSQVHALTELKSADLPEIIRALPSACFKNLDNLLCPNSLVSPNLLHWLAVFPAPITTLYSDSLLSSNYGNYINAVATFLRELPAKWDGLVGHCRQAQAPPLAQDLTYGLGIGSSVLQLVAFRAIARMIYDGPNDGYVLDHLELLHRYDQQACNQRYVRPPAEKAVAYQAFRRVRGTFNQWLTRKHAHEMTERNLPPMSKTAFPHFSLGWSCPDVPGIFLRQAPAPPAPNNAPSFTAQQARTPLQQQQAMIANEQNLRLQASHQSGASGRAPISVNTSEMAPRPQLNSAAVIYMPPQERPPNPRLLVFPHETDGQRSQPTEPNAMRSALHEAHLRSPVPVPLQIGGEEMPQLYRYVSKYALTPTRLNKDMPINILTFDLPQNEFDRIPRTIPSQNTGELDNRILSESSQTYRLRCCAMPARGFPTESDWVVADTHWPETMYLELNGHKLEARRPLHHKKFLPIDLTSFVTPGVNEVKVIINRTSTDTRPFNYALAVELVGVVSHSTLVGKLTNEQTISAASTETSIQKALSGASGPDDNDDLAITSTSMSIKLFDPFSGSKIFNTPVRGLGCPHKDCFDLETFLAQCKRDKPGMPTIVDCWRCPLCRGDVRPSMMVRDEWLVDVRKTLERQGKLDTRAVVVEADGSWKPKPEERTGVRSASLEREERGASAKKMKSNEGTPVPARPKKVIEVIELD